MKSKTKIFIGSALAATASVVTPLVTMVSCGEKPQVDPIVVTDKVKEIDGTLDITFSASLGKVLSESETISGIATDITSTPGWKVVFLPATGEGTDNVTLMARLEPVENAIPHDGEQFDFDVTFTCTNPENGTVWEHTVSGFRVTYTCGEGGLTPKNKEVATISQSSYVILEFGTTDQTIIPSGFEIEFLNIRRIEGSDVISIHQASTKPQIIGGILYVFAELEWESGKTPTDADDGEGIDFDIRIVGVDQEKYVWDQTFTGFNVCYTIDLIQPAGATKVITPEQIEAGTITKENPYEYNVVLYGWNQMHAENIKSITPIIANNNDDKFTIEQVGNITEQSGEDYNTFNLTLKVSANQDELSDQWIEFSLDIEYDFPDREYTELPYEGFKLPYISAKTNANAYDDDVATEAGYTDGFFGIHVNSFSSGLDTVDGVEVSVEQSDESKADVVYNDKQPLDPIEEEADTNLKFTIQPKEGTALQHNDNALFNIVLRGKNADGELVWKQTIKNGKGSFLNLIYKGTWNIDETNIETKFNEKNAEWIVDAPADYDLTGCTIDPDESSTVGVKLDMDKPKQLDATHWSVGATAVPTDKTKYNSLATGLLTITGKDDKQRDLPVHSIRYSLAYNGGFVFDGTSQEQVTDFGKTTVSFPFLMQSQKEWASGKIVKYEVLPSQGTTEGVSIATPTKTFTIDDSFTGNIDIPVELKRTDDGALVNGDKLVFDVQFSVQGEDPIILKGFSLTYKGVVSSGPTEPIGTPTGKDTAEFTFSSDFSFAPDTTATAKSIKGQKTEVVNIKNDTKKVTVTVKISAASGQLKDKDSADFELTFASTKDGWTERYLGLTIDYNGPKVKGTDIVKTTEISSGDPSTSNTATFTLTKIQGSFATGESASFEIIEESGSFSARIDDEQGQEFEDGDTKIQIPVYLFSKEGLKVGDSWTFSIHVHFKGAESWDQTIEGCSITIQEEHITCTTPNVEINSESGTEALFTPTATFTFYSKESLMNTGLQAEITAQSQTGQVYFKDHPAKVICEDTVHYQSPEYHTAKLKVSFGDENPIYENVEVTFTVKITSTLGVTPRWTQTISGLTLKYNYNLFKSVSGEETELSKSAETPTTTIKLFSDEFINSATWYGTLVDAETGDVIADKDSGVSIETKKDPDRNLEVTIAWDKQMISELDVGDTIRFYVIAYPEKQGYNEPSFVCEIPFTVTITA